MTVVPELQLGVTVNLNVNSGVMAEQYTNYILDEMIPVVRQVIANTSRVSRSPGLRSVARLEHL